MPRASIRSFVRPGFTDMAGLIIFCFFDSGTGWIRTVDLYRSIYLYRLYIGNHTRNCQPDPLGL